MGTVDLINGARSRARRALRWAVAVSALGLVVGAEGASADPVGWWHLGLSSRSAVLQPSHGEPGASEVQALTVSATGGQFVLEPKPEEFLLLPWNATHEEVEAALAGVYGAGNVEVPVGQGDEAGDNPYRILFKGALADRAVPLITAHSTLFEGFFKLEGGREEAKLVEEVAGHPLKPDGEIVLTASNLGDENIAGTGSPVQLSVEVPAGLKVVGVSGLAGNSSHSPGPVECSVETVSCSFSGVLPPFSQIEVVVAVDVEPGAASGEVARARVAGAGAREASTSRVLAIGSGASFGIDTYELVSEEEGGGVDRQAGSHPFQLTTTIALNQNADRQPVELAKDFSFKWPAGLIGDPNVVPRCTLGQFLHFSGLETLNECSSQTAVGVAMVTIQEPLGDLGPKGEPYALTVPVFSLEPARGEPARFGFLAPGTPVFIDVSVRTGGDYGVTVHVKNVSQTAAFLRSEVTIWGVPGDARHDGARGNGCLRNVRGELPLLPCLPLEASRPAPFLSLPTSCTGSLSTTVQAVSWAVPNPVQPASKEYLMDGLDGCNRLPFSPSIKVTPDGQEASTPTGLTVDVHAPQEETLNAKGLAEDDVKTVTVALPEGLGVNAASADGLLACSEEQAGFLPNESSPGNLHLTPERAFCPDAAKIGTVKITTPLLADPLEGAVYLAAQTANPFGSLLAMYIVAEDPVSGVLVKLPGEVKLTDTGQLVASQQTPEVAFEDAELHFFGGDRAPLATPARCGTYTTTASFAGWSGNEPVSSQSQFQITSGPHGSPCPSALPFSPSLSAGTTNIQAGGFSPLTTTISRDDGNQDIRSVSLRTPGGLSGLISSVTPCAEAQANAGTCGPESLIGHTIVSVGLGGDPFSVTGGQVFITGPYRGAPFGLSIVNPAKAGPFDLGKVVVRAKIEVDPRTAELTVTTDSEGPYAIPRILDGIPLQIKHVNVTIDRPGFTFNPTNCSPMSISATITSSEGAAAHASVPFQVTNCAVLKFTPKFSVSTSGQTSKANGASLTATLSYPNTPQGTEANIAKVKVALPKQLPSRLTTLQKACLAKTFETNPAACPAGSAIGHAKVRTPLLPVPLEGPAYFVSHGSEAFPSLTIVLQGDNVTVLLTGSTLIRNGITTTTFNTTPDVPFNSFELTLPRGKYSALAANGNLCKTKLTMPTQLIAQNGRQIIQNTPIAVTNCSKHHKHKAKKRHGKKRKKR